VLQVRFKVPTKPVGYDRDAAAEGYTPDEVTEWRKAIAVCYREAAPFELHDGRHVGLVLLVVEAQGTKADADNLAKEVMDALKGQAYRDDGQVCGLMVALPCRQLGPAGGVKKPTEEPGAEVLLVFSGLPLAV
jgi:Holliday junction resolvase RusA-like endonuclease